MLLQQDLPEFFDPYGTDLIEQYTRDLKGAVFSNGNRGEQLLKVIDLWKCLWLVEHNSKPQTVIEEDKRIVEGRFDVTEVLECLKITFDPKKGKCNHGTYPCIALGICMPWSTIVAFQVAKKYGTVLNDVFIRMFDKK